MHKISQNHAIVNPVTGILFAVTLKVLGLSDREDAEFLGGTVGLEFDAVAGFLTDQFHTQRRFGGDNKYFLAGDVYLSPAAFRAEKVERAGAARFEFDQRGEVDGRLGGKLLELERLILRQRLFDLGRLARLRTGEIRRLKSARVVLVFGLVLFVGGVGVHDPRCAGQRFEGAAQFLDDLAENT